MHRTRQFGTLSRRTALRGALATGLAATVAPAWARTALAQGTPAASPAALAYPVLLEEGPITIYDYGVPLPTDDISFRFADHQGVRVPFQEALHAAFSNAYPNISITYDSLGQDLAELLVVGVQSGDAHDIIPTNAGVSVAQGVAEGWLAPLDEVIPNFAEWKAAYPENTFLPGVNEFDGKTYVCPMYSSRLHRNLLYFNSALLEEAGYDPAAKALTWDEFRDAAKKVSETGNFGMANAGGPGANFVNTIAEIAGAHGGTALGSEFNLQTGDFNYTSDIYLQAIELMQAMNDDRSFMPGMASLTDTDVRAKFPEGEIGFYISGTWNVSIWEQGNPDFAFGVGSAPVPNSGEAWPMAKVPAAGEGYMAYSGSDYKEVAGALLAFIGSLEGNVALKEISKSINPVAFPEADQLVEASAAGQAALAINASQLRFAPHPAVRNVDTTIVEMRRRGVTPNLNDIVNGIFAGQVDDPSAALQDLQDRSNAEFERAIKEAQDEGAQVSRDDWKFENWDPTQDYTLDMYEAS
jgi:multiple sugar transport system substrate-binding protein